MKNNNIDVKTLLVKTLIEEFKCDEVKAEQVVLNVSTEFATKNNFQADLLFSEYGYIFKTFFEKNYGSTLNISNGDIDVFWTEMTQKVSNYKLP